MISGDDRVAFSFESLTLDGAALGFTSGTYAPSNEESAKWAYCTVKDNAVRVRFDGTAPTATVGHYYAANAGFWIKNATTIKNFKAIKTAAGNAALDVTFYRSTD